MRKLLDDRLVKIIDKMSDSPYEYYTFETTPMTELVIDRVETTGNRAQIHLKGEIEPYTKFYNYTLDLGLRPVAGSNVVEIYLPKMIEKDFEIQFYFDLPEGINRIQYLFFFEENEGQYFLYDNEAESQPTGINLTGIFLANGKEYNTFMIEKESPSQEENIRFAKINDIVYLRAFSA
ncbi:MAG: hypothetical protein J6R32_10945 [Bacteroidales bacterium]|nr:hypothetical protein [Bacteroidales bacterium]